MKITQIARNKYLDALLKLFLFSAVIHMIIITTRTIITGDLVPLNFFNLLDLEYIWPSITHGVLNHTLSGILALVIYLAFLFWRSKEKAVENYDNKP